MSLNSIIIATAVVAGVGLVIAVLLSAAEKIFHIDVDEKELKIREQLAGNNCGACGYAGCDALAKAISAGEAPANACPVSGKAAADNIAEIMGSQPGEYVKKTAFVKCDGSCGKRHYTHNYFGIKECAAASVSPAGEEKSCSYGCFGYGSCVSVCDNNAISIKDGLAVVNEALCVACGRCAAVCPKNLIEIIPAASKYRVKCSNNDRGKLVKESCASGCIGCGICKKQCPSGAVRLVDNLASIDYESCDGCGICAEKCPVKIIKQY